MRIVSWNIYNFFDFDYFFREGVFASEFEAKDFVDKRIKYFSEKLKSFNGDVIYLFEVGNKDLLRKLASEIYGEKFYIFETTPDRRGIYNACISRHELIHKEIFLGELELPTFVDTDPSFKDKYLIQKRGYIQSTIGNTLIYGVHLKSQLASRLFDVNGAEIVPTNSVQYAKTEILGEYTGLAEAYAIRKLISLNIEEGKDVIILGDFNTDTHSKRYKILRGLVESSDELISLIDEDDASLYSGVYRGRRNRLDHVLISSNLVKSIEDPVMHSDLVNVNTTMNFIDVNIVGSDHAPITFNLLN